MLIDDLFERGPLEAKAGDLVVVRCERSRPHVLKRVPSPKEEDIYIDDDI
jgi:hypothetical protein